MSLTHMHTHTYLQFKESISHLSIQAYVCLYEVHRGSCDLNLCSNQMTHTELMLYLFLCLCFRSFIHPQLALHIANNSVSLSLAFIFIVIKSRGFIFINGNRQTHIYLWLKLDVRKKKLERMHEKEGLKVEKKRQIGLCVDFLQHLTYTRPGSKRAVMGGWALAPCSVEQNGAVEMIHG